MKGIVRVLLLAGLATGVGALAPRTVVPQCVKCLSNACQWGPWAGGSKQCAMIFGFCDAWEDCDDAEEELQLAADGMVAVEEGAFRSGEWRAVANMPGVTVRLGCGGSLLGHILSEEAVENIREATARLSL